MRWQRNEVNTNNGSVPKSVEQINDYLLMDTIKIVINEMGGE